MTAFHPVLAVPDQTPGCQKRTVGYRPSCRHWLWAYAASVWTLKIIILVAFTIAFDAFVFWGIDFTIAWVGAVPPFSALGFWAFAISPAVVTAYCVAKLLAFRGGRSPRI